MSNSSQAKKVQCSHCGDIALFDPQGYPYPTNARYKCEKCGRYSYSPQSVSAEDMAKYWSKVESGELKPQATDWFLSRLAYFLSTREISYDHALIVKYGLSGYPFGFKKTASR